jgi:hypothetical protein
MPVTGTTGTANTDIDMRASIATFGGGYHLVDNQRGMLDLMPGGDVRREIQILKR